MKTPTDLACQMFLAGQDERIKYVVWKENRLELEMAFVWINRCCSSCTCHVKVEETEWAQIALKVEAKLNQAQKVDYVNGIRLHSKDKMSDFDCMNLGWKQRAIALAKAMGKELA